MPTAYITKRSFKLISSKLIDVIKADKNAMLDELATDFPICDLVDSQKLNEMLNYHEIGEMFVAKKLFENFSGVIAEIQNNQRSIKETIQRQNRHFVQEVKMPAYHSDDKCEGMQSGFFNITFPYKLSSTFAEQAKDWTRMHYEYSEMIKYRNDSESFQSSFVRLNQAFKQTFGCKQDLKIINLANSGTTSIDNRLVEDLVKNPYAALEETYLEKYTQLRFYFDGEFADKIRKLVYMPHYKVDGYLQAQNDPKVGTVVHEFHTVKQQLITVMTEAYQQKYGFDFSVDSEILDALGFRPCQCCYSVININIAV
jgi:hypothetical protein